MSPFKLKIMISETEEGISISSNTLASSGNLEWHFLQKYKIHLGYHFYHCKINESTRPERVLWIGSKLAKDLVLEEGQTVMLSLSDSEPLSEVTFKRIPDAGPAAIVLIPGIEILIRDDYSHNGESLRAISADSKKGYFTSSTSILFEEKSIRSEKSKSSQPATFLKKNSSDSLIIGFGELYEEVKNRVLLPFKNPELAQRYIREKLNGVIIKTVIGVPINRVLNKLSEESNAPLILLSIKEAYDSKSVDKYFNEMFHKALESPSGAIVHVFDTHVMEGLDDKGNAAYSAIHKELGRTFKEEKVITIVECPAESESADRFVRTGQFQVCIEAKLPNQQDREELIRALLPENSACNDHDIQVVAKRMQGYSIIEIQHVLRQAGSLAMSNSAGSSVDEKITPGLILEQLQEKNMATSSFGEFQMKPPRKSFNELYGYDKQIKQLKDIVDMETGRKEPKYAYKKNPNILLYGPPGTGKTHIAEGCAYHAGCSFFSFSAPQFMIKWVGDSAKNVRELFKAAREHAPTIIHIDEIDAIVAHRENTHTAQVITQLQTEMEGMTSNRGVIVIATTNHIKAIDAPILSRFNHQFHIDLPDEASLAKIIEAFLSPINEVRFNARDLARLLTGTSPRQIVDMRDAIVHKLNTGEKTAIKMFDILYEFVYKTPKSLTTIPKHRLS